MLITLSETTFIGKPRLVFDQTAKYHSLAKSTHKINLCSYQDSLFFCINAELLTAQSSRGACLCYFFIFLWLYILIFVLFHLFVFILLFSNDKPDGNALVYIYFII